MRGDLQQSQERRGTPDQKKKALVFTAGPVLLLHLLSIFLPLSPCYSWTETRWDARTAPTLPTPTPQPRAQAQIEAHRWIAAYQISGAALTPAPPRWVGRKAAVAWGARSRSAEEKPVAPATARIQAGPGFPFSSFLLCALTNSLSLSRPGSSNKPWVSAAFASSPSTHTRGCSG